MSSGGGNKTLKPWQFGLARLFVLTLVAAILLWAWRFGPLKLAGIVAVATGVLLSLVWVILIAKRLLDFGKVRRVRPPDFSQEVLHDCRQQQQERQTQTGDIIPENWNPEL